MDNKAALEALAALAGQLLNSEPRARIAAAKGKS